MQWKDELELAKRAALKAGALLQEWSAGDKAVLSDAGRDVKLQADRDAEAAVIAVLRESAHPILAEESGEHGDWDGDTPFWVVDPLDGTANYFRGVPSCAVSIGLCRGDTALLGVVYDFNRDDIFEGVVGEGAWHNGAPMRVAEVKEPKQGFIGTGFPTNYEMSDDNLTKSMKILRQYKKIRMPGSAALALAYVAKGWFDVYLEESILLWDVAAGIALIEAAGGVVHADRIPGPDWALRVVCGSCDEMLAPILGA